MNLLLLRKTQPVMYNMLQSTSHSLLHCMILGYNSATEESLHTQPYSCLAKHTP